MSVQPKDRKLLEMFELAGDSLTEEDRELLASDRISQLADHNEWNEPEDRVAEGDTYFDHVGLTRERQAELKKDPAFKEKLQQAQDKVKTAKETDLAAKADGVGVTATNDSKLQAVFESNDLTAQERAILSADRLRELIEIPEWMEMEKEARDFGGTVYDFVGLSFEDYKTVTADPGYKQKLADIKAKIAPVNDAEADAIDVMETHDTKLKTMFSNADLSPEDRAVLAADRIRELIEVPEWKEPEGVEDMKGTYFDHVGLPFNQYKEVKSDPDYNKKLEQARAKIQPPAPTTSSP